MIVTDGDPEDGIPGPGARAQAIAKLAGGAVSVEQSTVTFEWDLAANNPRAERLLRILLSVRPDRGATLRDSKAIGEAWATEFRWALGPATADFAQRLALDIDAELDECHRQAPDAQVPAPAGDPVITVPDYLRRVIDRVTPAPAESQTAT